MSKVKRYFLIFPILCIALIPCTSVFVSALPVFQFAISEPPVDLYHGYLILPYRNTAYNIDSASLYYWIITPVNVSDNDSSPIVTIDYQPLGNDYSVTFSTGQQNCSWFVQVYQYTNGTNGALYSLADSGVVSYSDTVSFSITFGSSISFYSPILQGISFLDSTDSFPHPIGSCSILWGDDTAFYTELQSANDKLTDLINNLDLTNEQLVELYSLLSDYLFKIEKDTTGIVSLVDQFYYEWYQWSWVEEEYYNRIIELLEQAIEGEKPSNQDSFQDSYDDYADIEQDLINNEEASNAIGDFDVSIEGGAYSVIWNMITNFLNTNSKVFGLFIACLTLAFIALLLHR